MQIPLYRYPVGIPMCHVSDALGCSRDPLLSSSCARILQTSQSVSQLFHGPAPRSSLHRLSVRFRRSRSNTSTEYSLPGATLIIACKPVQYRIGTVSGFSWC